MIVVHVSTLPDAASLDACYKGIEGLTVLINPGHSMLKKVLKQNPSGTVMFLGHGSQQGLFNSDMNGFLVGPNDTYLLKERTVIGIWCYASEFADKYELHGFFTSMFISNLEEALMNSFHQTSEMEISKELDQFCEYINYLLKTKTPLEEWVSFLKEKANKEIPFVRFNYEALTYLS